MYKDMQKKNPLRNKTTTIFCLGVFSLYRMGGELFHVCAIGAHCLIIHLCYQQTGNTTSLYADTDHLVPVQAGTDLQ